jgi:hypothetical protein
MTPKTEALIIKLQLAQEQNQMHDFTKLDALELIQLLLEERNELLNTIDRLSDIVDTRRL